MNDNADCYLGNAFRTNGVTVPATPDTLVYKMNLSKELHQFPKLNSFPNCDLPTISGSVHNTSLATKKYALAKQIDKALWESHIFPSPFDYVETAESVDICAIYCQMMANDNNGNSNDFCSVFYHDDQGKLCYVGNRGVTAGTPSVVGSHDVYFDPTFNTTDIDVLYIPTSHAMVAANWRSLIHTTEDLSAMDAGLQLHACKIMCYYLHENAVLNGGDLCEIYVLDGTDCHMGDNMNKTRTGVTSTNSRRAYKRASIIDDFYTMGNINSTDYFKSFINETKSASNNVWSLGDCCKWFYTECQTYHLVYPKPGTNKCHFGMATTTGGSITPSGTPWTVHIKEGRI